MYRQKYKIRRERISHLSDKKRRKQRIRFSRRITWYGHERRRDRACDRDIALLLRHINNTAPERPSTDSGDEDAPGLSEFDVETKLHVTDINLHIDDNTRAHHTDRYECTEDRTRESDGSEQPAELVIRRGQDFKMTINFDRPYDIKKNDITLTFSMGDDYKANKALNASFKVDETGKNTRYKPKKWGATVIGQKDNSLTLNVFVPASTPIGEWEFSVRTIVDVDDDGKDLIWQYNHNEDINIIFNPWCKEDWVYMEDQRWRNEAVLNDTGAQYFGSYLDLGARSWFFGQFEEGILDAAFHLLRMAFGFKASPGMGNAATVARMISQIVNSQDDNGVLTGNWTGKYEGGTSPTKWNGSVKILRQYMATGKPVKYGQCWVFSAVVTAVCRALGLPCRSVTNYASAHNTDTDRLSIDVIKKKNFEGDWVEKRDDSVWNFHVWNEVWMARPDLSTKKEWDGWQVIDATPQEYSDGVFCCGPAPVKAIKEGEITVGKDAAFIFAEVNADKVTWQEDTISGELRETSRSRNSVGKRVSTHAPTGRAYRGQGMAGTDASEDEKLERLDLTAEYKHPEGSPKEHAILRKAERMFRVMHGACILGEEEEEEPEPAVKPTDAIKIEIERPFNVFVGNSFEFMVKVTNTAGEAFVIKEVDLKVFYKSYFDTYNGIAGKKKFKDCTLEAGKTEAFKIAIDERAASAHPEDCFNFEIKSVVSFHKVEEVVSENLTFRLRRPDLQIKGPSSCRLSDTVKVEVSFTNPLFCPLTDCELEFEGGFKSKQFKDGNLKIKSIGPKKTWKLIVDLIPLKHPRGQKDRSLCLGFNSTQLQDIIGVWSVELDDVSRPPSPDPALTSIHPLGDGTPVSPPRTPSSTLPTAPADTEIDGDMYRRRYRTRRHSSSGNNRCHHNRFSRRFPWYSLDRWRPRASERDSAFWVPLNDEERDRFVSRKPKEEVEEEKPEVPVAELATKLHVKGIDLLIAENAVNHHTDNYECVEDRTREIDDSKQKAELVIRRGQDFKMDIEFDRPYDIKKNDITLIFNMGDDYKPNKALNAIIKVDETGKNTSYKPKKWGATVVNKKGNILTLNVFVPASVPIGEWEFSVRTTVDNPKGKDLIWQYNHNEDINIIFNPWCKEDWVYMEDEEWRNEVVQNDGGVQYVGGWRGLGAKPWNFGQFDDGILDAAFHLLRKGFQFRDTPGMGNPATVARLISQIVNSSDDDGVLTGNWSGDYEGGTSPSTWKGSVKILREYMSTKKPVKFGQCWVFSAVVTTVCRALGLPCRSVTNYSSAHNTDRLSIAIDEWKKRDSDGEWYYDKDDSVWNFHVWNEVWMSRPDLSDDKKWDGWQVIDATPQEMSDGLFCCGPAPVKAIKEGEITVGKDTEFVFAEVKADKIRWRPDDATGRWFREKRIRDCAGRNISTHKPTGGAYKGSSGGHARSDTMERLDLTDDYKYKAGTDKDREITKKAEKTFKMMNSSVLSALDDSDTEEDSPEKVEIEIEDPGDVCVGNPVEFVVNVKNITASGICVKDVSVHVFYKTYFDCHTGLATKKKFKDITIESGKTETFKIPMDEKVSTAKPKDSFIFEVVAFASFFDSDDSAAEDLTFRLRRPDIEVKGPKTCRKGETLKIEATFTNPLSVTLTDIWITMEGPFSWKEPGSDTFQIPDLGPGKTWKQTLSVTAKKEARKKEYPFAIGLYSTQLQEIIGYLSVELKE